jgi:F-type H+-transporting ATPase subunit b
MLEIDATFLVIFSIIWVLVFILSRVFWKPMTKLLDERKARIDGDHEASRQSDDARDRGLRDIEATLAAARQAADRVRDEVEVESQREKSRLLAEVSVASKKEMDDARLRLEDETARLKKDLALEAERLAAQIERKLLS